MQDTNSRSASVKAAKLAAFAGNIGFIGLGHMPSVDVVHDRLVSAAT